MKKITQNQNSIALLGAFYPTIFQPMWFTAQNLIKPQEGKDAKVDIIHPDIVLFNLEWARIQVARDKFVALSLHDGHQEEIYDLVLGTFKLLSHTPIHSMGVNKTIHFEVASEEEWHAIGNKLTPKEIWNNILEKPGMQNLTMHAQRNDDNIGMIRVTVAPSTLTKLKFGVMISINDHFEIKDKKNVANSDDIIKLLETNWKSSIERSDKIINDFLGVL